ncbi:MAG TPA: DNA polymerase III subunit beta [Candidatus Paceibacterota bacterium]|nr:DNA polymerase III subunit beta [Candidatus Paceibacterota bacterium]
MRITVSQKNLKQAVGAVEKVISKNTSLPILNNVLLKTENGRLKVSATNLEIGVNVSLGVKIDEAGEIAIPARIFSDFISSITDGKITLTSKDNSLLINSDHYKTQILGFDPKDFPIIPKIKTEPIAVIQSSQLKLALSKVLDSVAVSDTRPELAGVFMFIKNGKANLASTDGFRLSEVIIPFKHSESAAIILPRNTALELIRLAGDFDGDIEIRYNDNQISFSNEDIEVVSRVVDGTYPDYKKVIPEKFISRILINKDEFEKQIRLAGLFSSNISNIKLNCDDKNMVIVAKNSDKGEIETVVPVLLKNEPFEISINFRYILDGLKHISTPDVTLDFTGQGGPLVLRPNQQDSFTYLIMPLRN